MKDRNTTSNMPEKVKLHKLQKMVQDLTNIYKHTGKVMKTTLFILTNIYEQHRFKTSHFRVIKTMM